MHIQLTTQAASSSVSTEPAADAASLPASSQKAKEYAELFIQTLSTQETAPDWTRSPFLNDEEKTRLVQLFTAEVIKRLEQGGLPTHGFSVVGRGKYQRVYGHVLFPGAVFKIMHLESGKSQLATQNKALEITAKMSNCWIQIPHAMLLECGGMGVYVEKRLPLAKETLAPEFWARVLAHYETPHSSKRFKDNIHRVVDQIHTLILELGYWDVSMANLPAIRTDGLGICAIDFVNIQSQPQNHLIAAGFKRLAHIIPLPSAIERFKCFQTMNKNDEIEIAYICQKVTTLQRALRAYDAYPNAMRDRDGELEKAFDDSALTPKQKLFVQSLYPILMTSMLCLTTCISDLRKLEISANDLQCPDASHSDCVQVLNALLAQHKIVSWTSNCDFLAAVDLQEPIKYIIYF